MARSVQENRGLLFYFYFYIMYLWLKYKNPYVALAMT